MKKVLVTGAGGQLGLSIYYISHIYRNKLEFIYKSSSELNITNEAEVQNDFLENNYDYCINCAAYTNVDAAESDIEKVGQVNVYGAKNLAMSCKLTNTTLIHISTDFVFEGVNCTPYNENDTPSPIGAYGKSKHLGENLIKAHLANYYIVRTSWLYSQFGHNFMKSMIRFGDKRKSLSVVYDQVGTPTYAVDLARSLVQMILEDSKAYGVYHYSNEGVASWYDFANAIFELMKMKVDVDPIRSIEYPLPAKRPSYSVMDKNKIKSAFNMQIPHWRDSLKQALKAYKLQIRNSGTVKKGVLA